MTNIDRVLDISVNLARVSDWIFSESQHKQNRVDQFLDETKILLISLSRVSVSPRFEQTLAQFKIEFAKLLKDKNKTKREEWAERALTWANII